MNLTATLSVMLIASMGLSFADDAAELSPDAKRLQRGYQKSVEQAVAPLRVRYISELAKLYDQAMKDKKLTEAVALKQEMNGIISLTMTGTWRDNPGVMHIDPNGTLSHSNGATGTWKIEGDDMVLKWSNGAGHTFPIVETKEILRGKLDETTSVILTREK